MRSTFSNTVKNKNNTVHYAGLVQKLYKECCTMQNENERFVLRINSLKKMLKLRVREVELLKRRLDEFHDNWRSLPMVAPHPKRKIEQKRGPKPKFKRNPPTDEIKPPNTNTIQQPT